MRRRRIALSTLHKTGRTTLGGQMRDANNVLTKLLDRVAHASCPMRVQKEQLIEALWAPDVVARLRQAKGLVQPSSWRNSYSIGPYCRLSIDFSNSSVPTPYAPLCLQPPAAAFSRLVEDLKVIYERFCMVKHVLNWMDANATPGAIRHYWPTMLTLAPKCDELMGASSVRYVEPEGISDLLPLLRETATTVASALLTPQVDTYDGADSMLLTFGHYSLSAPSTGTTIETQPHPFQLFHAP